MSDDSGEEQTRTSYGSSKQGSRTELKRIDIFGTRIGLKYNGSNTMKTNFGGVMTVLYLIALLLLSATFLNTLVLGVSSGNISISPNLRVEEGTLNQTIFVDEVDWSVGFERATQLSSIAPLAEILSDDIGRFELLNVKRDGNSLFFQNFLLETCENSTDFWCPPADLSMEIWGNVNSTRYSVWMLQFRPCVAQRDLNQTYTAAEQAFWTKNLALKEGKTLYTASCQKSQVINDFLSSHKLVMRGQQSEVWNNLEAVQKTDPVVFFEKQFFEIMLENPPTPKVLKIKENIIIETSQDKSMLQLEIIDSFLQISELQSLNLKDELLTKGTRFSLLFERADTYDMVVVNMYTFVAFIKDVGGLVVGLYLLVLLAFVFCPQEKLDSELISKVYHVDDLETANARQFQKQLASFQKSKDPTPTLAERLSLSINMRVEKLGEEFQQTINTPQKFSQKLMQIAKDGFPLDKIRQNPKILVPYLSKALLRRPKFQELNFATHFACCRRSSKDRTLWKRFQIGRNKLSKDLDALTYLRTIARVKGIVHSVLDDKQRLLLKYQKHRLISLQDFLPDRQKVVAQKNALADHNLLIEKILGGFKSQTDTNIQVGNQDIRLLKGLTQTWVFEERTDGLGQSSVGRLLGAARNKGAIESRDSNTKQELDLQQILDKQKVAANSKKSDFTDISKHQFSDLGIKKVTNTSQSDGLIQVEENERDFIDQSYDNLIAKNIDLQIDRMIDNKNDETLQRLNQKYKFELKQK